MRPVESLVQFAHKNVSKAGRSVSCEYLMLQGYFSNPVDGVQLTPSSEDEAGNKKPRTYMLRGTGGEKEPETIVISSSSEDTVVFAYPTSESPSPPVERTPDAESRSSSSHSPPMERITYAFQHTKSRSSSSSPPPENSQEEAEAVQKRLYNRIDARMALCSRDSS